MSKTKTAVIELYQGIRGDWHKSFRQIVPIHLTRKDDWDKKWYYFNIPYTYDGKPAGKFKCKFQESKSFPYVFTKCFKTGKWQGNVQVAERPDIYSWVKIVSLDFAEVSHA